MQKIVFEKPVNTINVDEVVKKGVRGRVVIAIGEGNHLRFLKERENGNYHFTDLSCVVAQGSIAFDDAEDAFKRGEYEEYFLFDSIEEFIAEFNARQTGLPGGRWCF